MLCTEKTLESRALNKSMDQGFTLVELLIILVIISIVGMVAVPSLTQMLRNSRVLGVSNEVASLLNYARAEAIMTRKVHTVEIEGLDDDDGNFVIYVKDGERIKRQIDLVSKGITIKFEGSGISTDFGGFGHSTHQIFVLACNQNYPEYSYVVGVRENGVVMRYPRGYNQDGDQLITCDHF